MDIKRLSLLCGSLLALATLNGCDELTGADPGDLIDALVQSWLPLVEEAEWRYVEVETLEGESEGDPYVYTVSITGTEQRNGKTYFKVQESDGTPDLYRVEEGVAYMWPRDMPFEIPIFDMALAVGDSRPIEGVYVAAGDTMRMSGNMTYLRNETVTTPAGTFTDCRVFEIYGSFSMSSDPDFFMEGGSINWFGRGVGRVKEVHTFNDGVEQGTATVTLHYYRIPGGLTGGHDGTYTVTGRVVEYEGPPVAGVVVNLAGADEEHPTATTDAEGVYLFEGVRPGFYRVGVLEFPDNFWHTWEGIEFSVIDQDVVLDDMTIVREFDEGGGILQGSVKTPDGFGIATAQIEVRRHTAVWHMIIYDEAGDFFWGPYPPGTYILRPMDDHFTFSPDSLVVTLTADGVEGLDFVGIGGASVTGQIVTPLGIGLGGIEVGIARWYEYGIPRQIALSNAEGYYTFINLPDGEHWISGTQSEYFFDPDHVSTTVTDAQATAPADFEVEPNPLSWNYTVSGTFRNARGHGPWGDDHAAVTLYSTLFGLERSALVDWSSGTYTVSGLFDGPFTITASSAHYPINPPASTTLTVAGQNVTGQNFTFTGFTLQGRIVDTER